MKALQSVVESLRAQRTALDGLLQELEDSAHASMAAAMFDVVIRETLILVNLINEGKWPVAATTAAVMFDEDNLDPLLGKPFMRRLRSLQDLSSTLVEQICTAADEITNDARATLGLPPLKRPSLFSQKYDEQPAKPAPREENRDQVLARSREFLGVSLRDYACALESQLETLQNMLSGAALYSLSQRMAAPVPKTDAKADTKSHAKADAKADTRATADAKTDSK